MAMTQEEREKKEQERLQRLYGESATFEKVKKMSQGGYSNSALSSVSSGTYKKIPVLNQTRNDISTRVPTVGYNNSPKYNQGVIGSAVQNDIKPSTRYSNRNVADSLRQSNPNRDTAHDEDFDAFFDWRYNKMYVTDYDAATDTEVEHWRNVKKDIMKKNNWTEKEFDDRFAVFDRAKSQQMANEEIAPAIEFAKAHPVAGTLLQEIYLPQTWVEGGASVLQGATQKLFPQLVAQSSDDPLFTGTRLREGVKQAVKDENIDSKTGKFVYDMGIGLADMVAAQGAGGAGPILNGLASGARNQMTALERGITPSKAATIGMISGIVSSVMNKVGLDKALGAVGSTAAKRVGKAALTEGLENIVEDSVNLVADSLINQKDSELVQLKEYYLRNGFSEDEATRRVISDKAGDMATSALSGALFGGIMSGTRNASAFADERMNRNPVVDVLSGKKSGNVPDIPRLKPTEASAAQSERTNATQAFHSENAISDVQYKNGEIQPTIDIGNATRVTSADADNLMVDLARIATTGTDIVNGIDKVRSFSERASYDDNLPEEVRNVLKDDYYKIARNPETSAKAEQLFIQDNLDQSRSNLEQALEKKDPAAPLLSYKLARAYVDNGKYDSAIDVMRTVSEQLTKAGQFTQAAKLAMLQNDPLAAARMYVRDLDSINEWGQTTYKKKWKNLEITSEDLNRFRDIAPGDTEKLSSLVDELNAKFGKEIPASKWEKFVSHTKTSMLLNPRTQVRNVGSNVAMLVARSLSDRVSALGQNAVWLIKGGDLEKTQSLHFLGGTKAQRKIAGEIFESMKDDILGENKMKDSTKHEILRYRQIHNDDFFAKWIDNMTDGGIRRLNERFGADGNRSTAETLKNLTYWLMGEVGDTPFVKLNFQQRLASYMNAQKITNIDDVPDDAIAIATQEALKATFKDDNAFSNALQGIKPKMGKFGEVALPFVKTPANITMRTIDYSPAGLINTFRKAKSGAEINTIIDELSMQLTGTAMIFLGYKLRESGLLTGTYSKDKKERGFQKRQGMLENAFKIGDRYVGFSWVQPFSAPFIIGSMIYDAVRNSDEGNKDALAIADAVYNGGINIANSIIESSPLQSFSDMAGRTRNEDGGLPQAVANETLESWQRLIPSALGATARVVDPTYRDTYSNDSTVMGLLRNQATTAAAKIPFLSKTLPASYDQWGNERKRSDSVAESMFAQYINPGQFGRDTSIPIDEDIKKIYEETGNVDALPRVAERSVNLGKDGTKKLTNREHSEYQQKLGRLSRQFAEKLLANQEFKKMPYDTQAKVLKEAYDFANVLAKEKLFNHITDSDKTLKTIYNAKHVDGAVGYWIDKQKANDLGLNYDTYAHSKNNYKGGAEQYAENRQKAKQLGIDNVNDYDNWQKKYHGGAEQHVSDQRRAAELGFSQKERANSSELEVYNKAASIFGDDEGALREYAEFYNRGITNNINDMIYAMNRYDWDSSQKGYILKNGNIESLGKNARFAYDNDGWAGVYNYYLIKQMADANGNGKINSAERKAFFNDPNNYSSLEQLSEDMLAYLSRNLE